MAPSGSKNSNEEGNTKPRSHDGDARISPAKYWSFTSFRDNLSEIQEAWAPGSGIKYVVGREICPNTQNKHLQGFVIFNRKCRPLETWKHLEISHWEKCRGNEEQNIKYCMKEGDYVQQGFDDKTNLWNESEVITAIKGKLERHFGDYEEVWRTEIDKRDFMKEFVSNIILELMYTKKKVKVIKGYSKLRDFMRHILFCCICASRVVDI